MDKKNIHLVLIHGFAAHKNIWGLFAEKLAENYTLHRVDLPGYGEHTQVEANDLPELAQQVLLQIPALKMTTSSSAPKIIWVGWSLGGVIAYHLAQLMPEFTQGVITLAFNPQFIASEDWPCGVKYGVFYNLKQAFLRSPEKAMLRFISLQGQGLSRALVKKLLVLQKQFNFPAAGVFIRDLNLVAKTNMREMISKIPCPQLNILGTQDRIVPIELVQHLKYLSAQVQNVTIKKAGHVMFLSHMTECLTSIDQFINESIIA